MEGSDENSKAANPSASVANKRPKKMEEEHQTESSSGVKKLKRPLKPHISSTDSLSNEQNRIFKLKRIVDVLKYFNSAMCSEFRTPLPTMDVQRMYQLIASHVDYCIFLYIREDSIKWAQSHLQDPLLDYEKCEVGDANQPLDLEYVMDYFDDPYSDFDTFSMLFDCLPETVLTLEEQRTRITRDYNYYKKQGENLLYILYELEEMGRTRHFAPPNEGDEINYYKEIRECVTYSLWCIQAAAELHVVPRSDTWCTISSVFPDTGLIRATQGYRFALALDLKPMVLSIFKRYKDELSSIFSPNKLSTLPFKDYNVNVDEINNYGDNISLQYRCPDNDGIMKTKLKCLMLVKSKLLEMKASTFNYPPTDREVRLYAQLVEHVSSSIWLAYNPKATDKPSHNVNVALVKEDNENKSATRERYLLEIVSYLNAIKSSCLAARPTQKELKCYFLIDQQLNSGFMSPPVSAERELASLKNQLTFVHKEEMNFCKELRDEVGKMVNSFRCFIMGNEGKAVTSLSADEAFNWIEENNDQLANKVKDYFLGEGIPGTSNSTKLGELAKCYVILNELCLLYLSFTVRLTNATSDVDNIVNAEQDHVTLAKELQSALYVICKSQLAL